MTSSNLKGHSRIAAVSNAVYPSFAAICTISTGATETREQKTRHQTAGVKNAGNCTSMFVGC